MEADQLQQLQQQQQQQQQQSNANLQSDPKPSNSSFSSDNNNSNANVKSNDNSNANTNVNNNMPPVVSTAIATTAVNSPPKRPNMDVITSTSSPIAYRSTRSLNANPPPPSFDQVSLPSIESDTALLQHHRQQQQQRSGSQRGGGDQSLLLGFQMFEQQQKEWDRKKQQQTIIRKSNSGGNRGRTTEGEGGGKVYINNTTTTTTNNHNNREPQDQQHYQHQQHYQQHYQNTYYNNMGDVPTTVHFRSSDGDDVSESLKDETTIGVMTTISAASGPTSSGRDRTSGGGSNNKSNHHPNHNQVMKRVNSLGKFLKSPLKTTQNIKRNISDRFNTDPIAENDNNNNSNSISNNNYNNEPSSPSSSSSTAMRPILYGYLHKLGRNGKWQKRYFESDGTSLMYYKTIKRTSILATLDLLHVGNIQLDNTDPSGCTFMIEVRGRNYYLSADTKERARDWVISLNRVKEARLQIGGLKLIEPMFHDRSSRVVDGTEGGAEMEGIIDPEEDEVAPRIVMVAARRRTKGLGKDDFSEMEKSFDGQITNSDTKGTESQVTNNNTNNNGRHLIYAGRAVQHNAVVRWKKNRNAIQNWTRRVSRWARRITMIRCIVEDDVVHLNQNLEHQGADPQNNFTDVDRNPSYQQPPEEEEDFIDLSNSHRQMNSDSKMLNLQVPVLPFPDEVQDIMSKESIETSGFYSTTSAPSRMSTWKPSQVHHRLQGPSVQEENGQNGSIQSSSGRVTPKNDMDDDDDGGGTIT